MEHGVKKNRILKIMEMQHPLLIKILNSMCYGNVPQHYKSHI